MTEKRPGVDLSRRAALAAAAALGGGVAACATVAATPPNDAFQGRIGPTFPQSTPDFASGARAPASAPNILVIVLDDVGFADLGCYGGEIGTPNIDALASGGLRYSNFRTTAVCSSTRASLLTGLNPHSAGMGWLTFADEGFPGYRGDLSPDAVTLSETLSASGYLCYHSGKWHVNADASATSVGPFANWPLQRGYRRAYWFQGHSLHYFRPSNVFDGNQRQEIAEDRFYATEAYTESAIRYLQEHAAQAGPAPFFMSLAYSAAHSPLHAPADDIAAQKGRYDDGWDRVREQRLARQIELGVVPADTQLPARNRGVAAWDELSADQRRLYSRYMEVYAAVLARADACVGRVVAALRETGAFENTLIVLLSDNGGAPDGGATGTPNLFASGVGGVALSDALALLEEIGGPDTYPIYPMGWAMASNTPFKMYKHDTHLGGVADPLVIHWPKGIAARGEVRRQYAHVCDIFPTLLASAGVPRLRERLGRPVKPVQGLDFSSTFTAAEAAETRVQQHFEMNGTRALYANGWRLVSKGVFEKPGDGWELYDLSQACNERVDVASTQPDKVAEMERVWLDLAHRYDVFPIDTRSLKEKSWGPFFIGGARSRWSLPGSLDLMSEEAAPALIGRSHRVEISLGRSLRRDDQGVLYAYGNMFLGCVLYIQDGRLIHEFVSLPRSLRTEAPAPIGAMRLVVRHEVTSRPWRGTLELAADGAQLTLKRHDALLFGRPMQGLQLGRNGSTPVSKSYQRPFAFTGELTSASIELDNSPYMPDEVANALTPPRP